MRVLPMFLVFMACTTPPDEALPDPEVASADAAVEDEASLKARALDAYQRGDLPTFVALQERVVDHSPDNTISRYNLACGYARIGRSEEAIRELRTLLDAGVDYGAAHDADFESLAQNADFQQILADYEAMHPVISHGHALTRVGERLDLGPEGLAVDPATGRTFISSMRTGEIYLVDAETGEATVFATLLDEGVPMSAYGLEVDAARNTLWAIGATFSLHEAYDAAHQGKTAVFAVDLQTGAIRRAYHPRGTAPDSGFHDLAIAADGTIYLSGGALYSLDPEATHAEPVPIAPAFSASRGIAFGSNPDVLYVAAERTGIARVDLSANKWSWVGAPEGIDLRGIDHLTSDGESLIGIQLGLRRWRAIRLDLSSNGEAIDGLTVLEQGQEDIAFASSGVIVDDAYRFVARAPLPPGTDRTAAGPAGGHTWLWTTPVRP